MSARSLPLAWCIALGFVLAPTAPAFAQSARDLVREHVEGALDEDDAPKRDAPKSEAKPGKREDQALKPKPKPSKPPRPPEPKPARDAGEPLFELSTDAPAHAGPSLPQRVLGKDLRLDLKIGGGYRGWVPQQYPNVDVAAGSYYVWSFEVKAKLFRFLNLRRGYYESNSLGGPRTDEAAVAAEIGAYVPKAAWLLAVLGFPIFKVWEPIIRYESRSFRTEARPQAPVCVVTDAVAEDLSQCVQSADALRMTSGFETFVLGVRYDKSKDGNAVLAERKEKLPPLTFGIGLMSYRKPTQVSVAGATLEEYLFDGRFRGAGLVFGTEVGGGPDRLFLDVDAQFGLGEIVLTDDLELNALAPEDWLLGYVQGNVTVGYHFPLVRAAPTLMLVPQATGGGASFFFFKTKRDADDTGEAVDTAGVNWDFLWSVNVSLVLSL